MSIADQIDVFYGRVTHSSAQVYVRVSSLGGGGSWSITGHVHGPQAPETRTLPTTVGLSDLGEGATLLASCTIPDPTFWTTQLPSTYEIRIQLRRAGAVVEEVVRSLGIRFFGASGRDFFWEGKRWVLRGVVIDAVDVEVIDDFRDNAGVLVVKDAPEVLLRYASQAGVLLVVESTNHDRLQELRRLACWPAVAIVILPSGCEVTSELRTAAANLLFAERVSPGGTTRPSDWAQAVFCEAANPEAFERATKHLALPIVAQRRLNGDYTLLEARRECDRLQRDLAPLGDVAGYVVGVNNAHEITSP